MAMQRDYIIEGEDRITIGGSEELQTMVDRLPATPLLSVTDVAAALDLSRDVIYAWIDSGQFKIFCGTDTTAIFTAFSGARLSRFCDRGLSNKHAPRRTLCTSTLTLYARR